jgi:hypothetical protein
MCCDGRENAQWQHERSNIVAAVCFDGQLTFRLETSGVRRPLASALSAATPRCRECAHHDAERDCLCCVIDSEGVLNVSTEIVSSAAHHHVPSRGEIRVIGPVQRSDARRVALHCAHQSGGRRLVDLCKGTHHSFPYSTERNTYDGQYDRVEERERAREERRLRSPKPRQRGLMMKQE